MKGKPMSKRKPKTQSAYFASFSMHELAEVIVGANRRQHFTKEALRKGKTIFIKPKQNE